jgi:Mce-associated membrane protein
MSDQDTRGRKRIAGHRPARPTTPAVRLDEPTELATELTTEEPTELAIEEAAEQPEVAEDAAEPGGRRIHVLVAALALLLVATLTVGGILAQKAWTNHQEEQGRDAAAGAASKAAALVLSYDYRKLKQDFAAARATLTPDFATKFDATTKVVGEQAAKTKATVVADVREVSVSDSSADVVNVLLFVNQTTTSTVTQGKPRVDMNRARFTMVRSGDGWLVQEVAGL